MGKELKIEVGKFYRNGRGDLLGPMREPWSGAFQDHAGCLYHSNGQQWDHVPSSTGNIVSEYNPHDH